MGGEITDKEVVLHHPNGTVYHFPAGTPTAVIEQQKAKLAPKPEPTWLQKAKDWATTTIFPETFKGIQKNTDQLREWLGRVRQVPYAGQRAEPLISAAEQASAVGQGVANAGAGMTSPVGIATVPLLGTLFAAGTPGWMLQGFASAGMGYNAAKGWQEAANLPAPEKTTARTEAAINALFGAALAKNMLTPVPRVPVSIRTTPPRRFVPTAQTARAEVLPSTPAPTPTPAIAARPEPVQPKVSAPYQRDPAIVAQQEALTAKQAQAKAAWEALARGENPMGPAPGGWDTTPLDQIPEGELGLTGKQPTNVMGVFTPQPSMPVAPAEPRPVGALGLTGEAGPATPLPATPMSTPKPVGEQPVGSLGLGGVAGETKPLPSVPETGLSKLDVKAFEEKYPKFKKANPEVELEPEMVPVLEEAVDGRIGDMVSLFESGIGELSGKGIPISAEEWMRLPIETTANMKTGYGAVKVKMGFPELANIKGSPSDILKAIRRDKNNAKYLEIRDAALKAVMQAPEMKGEMQTKNEALRTIKQSGGDSEAVRLLLREGWEPEDVLMNMEERKGLRGEEGFADIREFRHKGRNAEDLKLAAVSALRRNDLLGFDTAGEALAAIRDHADWANRWEVIPSDHAVLQAWRDLRMQEPMPTDIWRDVIQPSARALRKEMVEENAVKARKKFSVVPKSGEEGYADIARQKAGYIGPGGEIFPLREGRVHTPQTGAEYGATYRYWPPFSEGESGTLAVNFRGVPSRTIIDAVRELVSDTGADLNWEITQNNRTTHYGMNLRGLMRDLARIRGEEGSIDLSQLSYKEKVEKLARLAKIETSLRSEIATQTLTREEKFAKENLLQSVVSQQTRLRRIIPQERGEEGSADFSFVDDPTKVDPGHRKFVVQNGKTVGAIMRLKSGLWRVGGDTNIERRYKTPEEAAKAIIRERGEEGSADMGLRRKRIETISGLLGKASKELKDEVRYKLEDVEHEGPYDILDAFDDAYSNMESWAKEDKSARRLLREMDQILLDAGYYTKFDPNTFQTKDRSIKIKGEKYDVVDSWDKWTGGSEEGFADISKKDQKGFDFTPVDVPGQQKGQAAEDLFQQILNAKDSSVSKRELLGLNKKKKAPKEPPKDSLFAPRTMFKD